MPYLLTIEIQRDADGYRAAVVDLGDDAVLFVSDRFAAVENAVHAAQVWIEDNQ